MFSTIINKNFTVPLLSYRNYSTTEKSLCLLQNLFLLSSITQLAL